MTFRTWAIVAVAIMAVSITLAGVVTVQAQDSELIRVEDDHLKHVQGAPFFTYIDYMWVYNPTNITFTYGENDEYTADPIEYRHWDVIPIKYTDPVTNKYFSLNDEDLVRYNGYSEKTMLIHTINATETQALQIQELQGMNEGLQAYTVEQLALNEQLSKKLAVQAKRIAALETTLAEQAETIAAMQERQTNDIPNSPLPPS